MMRLKLRMWTQRFGRRGPLCVGLIACLAFARGIEAQSCSQSIPSGSGSVSCTINVTMPTSDILKLTLTGTTVALGTPGETDFTNGFKDITGAAVTATVRANRAFRLQVVGSTTNFSFANMAGNTFANPSKPASDLVWATTQSGLTSSTNNMGTTASVIAQGATSSVSQAVFFRTKWQFNRDVPGNYSLLLNFTLSAP